MRLDEAIFHYFTADELAALAGELGVRRDVPAGLPGDTAATGADLVEALARDGRAADLIDALADARPDVPWAELPYPVATLRRLHDTLCRRNDLDGLRTLCFHLGLDPDELPGETKAARARELVLAMDRLGRSGELLARYPRVDPRNEPRLTVSDVSGVMAKINSAGHRVHRLWGDPRFWVLVGMALVLWAMASGGRPNANHEAAATATQPAAPSPVVVAQATTGAVTVAPATLDEPAAAATGIPAISPTTRPAATPHPPEVIVGEKGANLREGPGPEYPVVATLRTGARLELLAVSPSGAWYQVRLPGKGRPWIDAGFATLQSGVGGLPVATAGSAAGNTPSADEPAETTVSATPTERATPHGSATPVRGATPVRRTTPVGSATPSGDDLPAPSSTPPPLPTLPPP